MHIAGVKLFPERYPTEKHYPFNLEVLRRTRELVFETPVTFFVGENGTGKSSLLEAICRRCGIHQWQGIERTRLNYNPYEDKLHRYLKVEWTNGPVPGSYFGSESFRHFVEGLDEWCSTDPGLLKYFGGRSLIEQSHGQSLMSYFTSRYKIRGLYLLDEPETALSPSTQVQLLQLFAAMGEAGHAQFIVATHSPILLACPGATIFSFNEAPVREVAYPDTEHFQVYKAFMADPQAFLP